jgi:hypothetical protein
MKAIPRAVAVLCAFGILYGVVWLGIASGTNPKFVVWFGIASAIAAPVGLTLFGAAFTRSDRDLIQRLAKVPEVERLIAAAKTEEERLRLLQAEQAKVVEIIRLESRRQATRERIEGLERDATRILHELDALDAELSTLDEQGAQSLAKDELDRLRRRIEARERGDVLIRIGKRTIRFDRNIMGVFPIGVPLMAVLRIVERTQRPKPDAPVT